MNIHEFLKERGYKGPVKDQFKDAVYFYRKVPGTNHHQYVVREWGSIKIGDRDLLPSYEVEMVYETYDGTWVDSKFYSINAEDLVRKLPDLENRLYAAVEAMGGDTNTYRGAKEEEEVVADPYMRRKRNKKVVL